MLLQLQVATHALPSPLGKDIILLVTGSCLSVSVCEPIVFAPGGQTVWVFPPQLVCAPPLLHGGGWVMRVTSPAIRIRLPPPPSEVKWEITGLPPP